MEGKMTQAERVCAPWPPKPSRAARPAPTRATSRSALLADVLYELGDARQARALLEDKLDMLERIAIPDAVLRVYRVLAAAHWQAGNPAGRLRPPASAWRPTPPGTSSTACWPTAWPTRCIAACCWAS